MHENYARTTNGSTLFSLGFVAAVESCGIMHGVGGNIPVAITHGLPYCTCVRTIWDGTRKRRAAAQKLIVYHNRQPHNLNVSTIGACPYALAKRLQV